MSKPHDIQCVASERILLTPKPYSKIALQKTTSPTVKARTADEGPLIVADPKTVRIRIFFIPIPKI